MRSNCTDEVIGSFVSESISCASHPSFMTTMLLRIWSSTENLPNLNLWLSVCNKKKFWIASVPFRTNSTHVRHPSYPVGRFKCHGKPWVVWGARPFAASWPGIWSNIWLFVDHHNHNSLFFTLLLGRCRNRHLWVKRPSLPVQRQRHGSWRVWSEATGQLDW